MRVYEILDELTAELTDSPKAMFSKNRVVDIDLLMEMLEDLKNTLPEEIKRAQEVIDKREAILADAQAEAKSIVDGADDRVSALVEEQELTRQAYIRAKEITDAAQANAREVREGVTDYADELLKNVETDIQYYLDLVRDNRRELKKSEE